MSKKLEHLGMLLLEFRNEVLNVSQQQFSDMILAENPLAKMSRQTLNSLENNYRPDQKHAGAEFYKAFENLFGINLYLSVPAKRFIVVDPTKLRPEQIQKLKKMRTHIKNIPLFAKHLPPFNNQKKYPRPVDLLSSRLCPKGEFVIKLIDDAMAPAYNKGEYVFCGKQLMVKQVKHGNVYLLTLNGNPRATFKIGKAEKNGKMAFLVQANSNLKPIAFTEEAIKGIYKVVGHHRGEAGINQ